MMPRNLHAHRSKRQPIRTASSAPTSRRRAKRSGNRRPGPGTPHTPETLQRLTAANPSLNDPPRNPWSLHATVCSVMIGAAISILLCGAGAQLGAVFDGPSRWVVGGAFLGLCLGVAAPRRAVRWLGAYASRWLAPSADTNPISAIVLRPDKVDVPMLWLLLSATALAAGFLALLLPLSVRIMDAVYDWWAARFVLSDPFLIVAWTILAGLALAAPAGAIGLATVWCHRLARPHRHWETSTTGALLMGAAMGAWLGSTIPPVLSGPIAALPCLAACLLAAKANQLSQRREDCRPIVSPTPLPQCSDFHPQLIRRTVNTVGALMIAVFIFVQAAFVEQFGSGPSGLAAALAVLGIGILAGQHGRKAVPSGLAGLGLTILACGVLLVSDGALRSLTLFGAWVQPALLAVVTMLMGYAFAEAQNLLLDRVASRSSAGTTTLARTMLTAAILSPPMVALAHSSGGVALLEWGLAAALPAFGAYLLLVEFSHSSSRAPSTATPAPSW